MADENPDKVKKPLSWQKLIQLSYKLDSEQAHTSFGKLAMSQEQTAPNFTMQKAGREDQAKVFLGALTVQENMGRGAADPTYLYEDNIKYKEMPAFTFGGESRMAETKVKYDHYDHVLFNDEPAVADNARRPKVCAPKIGTEPRMQESLLNQTPGPQYLIKERPESAKAPNYTFGHRRKTGGGLETAVSTPAAVGPARYVPEAAALPSTKQQFPRWTLPKAPRPPTGSTKFDKNQTYDTRSAFGAQVVSKTRTGQKAHFGSQTRNGRNKEGMFASELRSSSSIKILMPRF